jgi:signal transduction histidine kinase
MRLPRFSDIPIVYKISLPQAFAVVMLGSIGAFLVGSQQRQTVVLEGFIKADSLQTQFFAASQSIAAANAELYMLVSYQASEKLSADNQDSFNNVLGELDDARAKLLKAGPDLTNVQKKNLVGVLQELNTYRSAATSAGLMHEAELNAAPGVMQPIEAIYARITATLNETSESVAALAAAQATQSVHKTTLITNVMITLIAAALLLVMTVAPLIINAVQLAIILICEATEALAAGQNDLNLERLERGDEFGAIVRSLIIFRKNQLRIIAMQAEKEAIEEQAKRAIEGRRRDDAQRQKMEGLGRMTGGIAHEINNLLQPISLLGQDILDNELVNDGGAGHLAVIIDCSKKAKDIIGGLLAFSRPTARTTELLVLPDLLEQTLRLVRQAIPRAITISVQIADHLPAIDINRTTFTQILLNLSTNAAAAMGGRGSLNITAGKLEDEPADSIANDQNKKFVRICVTDTGCGMSQATLERAFEPFFTTKEIGQGTGLGLSVVFGLVTEMGGKTSIVSEPDRGTSVSVLIPCQ